MRIKAAEEIIVELDCRRTEGRINEYDYDRLRCIVVRRFPRQQFRPAVIPGVERLLDKRLPKTHEEYFVWPSSGAPRAVYSDEFSSDTGARVTIGPLKRHGYTCGYRGQTERHRRFVLKQVFETEWTSKESFASLGPTYLEAWGGAERPLRLYQMAATITRLRRNGYAQAAGRDFSVAIAHWGEDLAWLRQTYYWGWFGW